MGYTIITGEVTAAREARIRLRVRGTQGQEVEVNAVVDTGFTDALTLPPALITSLGLPFRDTVRALLADGSIAVLDVYKGAVLWDGEWRTVYIHAAEGEALVGMALLTGYILTVDVVDGGVLTIKARG